jgi:hypothetical protein
VLGAELLCRPWLEELFGVLSSELSDALRRAATRRRAAAAAIARRRAAPAEELPVPDTSSAGLYPAVVELAALVAVRV